MVMQAASTPPWGFRAFLTKPHDGDSFWMMCDTGFGSRFEPELRLDGVHAPEIHPLQPGGLETLGFVNGWLDRVARNDANRRWPFWVSVVMTSTFEPDMQQTFTRYVATVWPFSAPVSLTGRDVSMSLNAAVNTFLSGHPEWGGGD